MDPPSAPKRTARQTNQQVIIQHDTTKTKTKRLNDSVSQFTDLSAELLLLL